ncbi:hypothetical protein [Alphaproteobacteria bacterium endosymbiont of Tiliacea citrago]|uniref:hypothetical protein n=1 Tax=Alphaproteobacteria bacterium endosymbiont of Tiliacea citrago TaxID=3077944 RepID=UPI00313CFF9C
MLNEDKSIYFEYFSIAFCAFSFFYLSHICYQKFYTNKKKSIEVSFKNFEIYNETIKKYNGKVISFKIVDGYVEAFVEKNEFNYEEFDDNEPYQIEQFDDRCLITFKSIKKVSEKKILKIEYKKEEQFDINRIKINSFFFINANNWSININNEMYSNQKLKINEHCSIIEVSENFVNLKYNDQFIKIDF